ncbi:hypothetical protein NHQ30_008720 [Ciborinia camelliae]|nr:hypothetical protein NHQ30_008720 [Ciborinia camelliae]
MPVFNEYQYEPLCTEEEARFIILEPVKDSKDPLSCSIVQCRRSAKNLEYCAVSYVWGEPEFSENLEIKHDGDASYLRITPIVEALLRRLRACNVRNHLWIDAICINQADKDEKAQQIPVMGRIYEEAKVVHIWLGNNDPMTVKVFSFIRKASRLPEVGKIKMASQVAELMNEVFGGGGGIRGLQYFCDFSDRPWFSRRWIIQEACLAQYATIHCGSYSIPLPSLVLAAKRFQSLDISSYPIKVMANLRRPATKITILELLWNFHEARCLLPNDRIAAIYGLISEEYRVHLDYTADWTELYKEVVTGALKAGNNDTKLQVLLHLFEFGSISRPEDTVYPSWVPDWRQPRRRILPYYSWIRTPDTYEAYPNSPGHSAKATVTFHHNILQIHWHTLSSRLRARQVIYATKSNSAQDNGYKSAENVLGILNELFPRTSNSAPQLFALSYLIEKIVRFRHSDRDQKSNCPLFDAYIGSIHSQGRPKSSKDGVFNSLRGLGSLLQEFCLFKLESIGSRSETNEAYGICTQQIQVGDVMIPLWSPDMGPYWRDDLLSQEEGAIYMRTMVAVRRIGEKFPQRSTRAPSDRKQAETGRIIGSAVCVLIEPTCGLGNGLSVDTSSNDHTKGEQCLMRLV